VPPRTAATASIARKIEASRAGSLFLVGAGIAYLAIAVSTSQIHVDINLVIFLFLIAGLALHGRPLNYADAVKSAARQTGTMMLQYPIYGGIMGIMTATGLAVVIYQRRGGAARSQARLSFRVERLSPALAPPGPRPACRWPGRTGLAGVARA
jgi:short subunit fatty acids transporter